MNSYELILVFDPILGEDKIGQFIGKIEDKVKSLGGELEKVEKWGTRRLASVFKKAKKLSQGYYVLVVFKCPASAPAEIRSFLKVSESVIRYFISCAVEIQTPPAGEKKEIAGKPLEAVPVTEIKGEPLG